VNRLYMHQGRNFAEYGVLANRPPEHVLSLVTERVGLEHLERARASGRGCLLVTGHLGFFELGGLMISQMGFPVTALTLPEPTNELTRWRADFRGRWGVGTIEVGPASFGVVDIVRELRAGKFIAMLMDRPWDVNTVDIELPCGRTRFAAGPAMIALLAGCSLIPVATVRRPDGGYRIVALGYLEPKWLPEGRDATLAHYTREAAAMLVPEIARHGDQWFQFVPAWVGGENEASGTGTSRETARNS
jgi:KDO2-lipid IV(A) lauroyltransferase